MRRYLGWIKLITVLAIVFTGGWLFSHKTIVEQKAAPKTESKTNLMKRTTKKEVTSTIPEPIIEAKAAVLIHASNGEFIYKKNETEPYSPASMSKMMTAYILLEHIHKGKIHWKDKVSISEKSEQTEGAKIPIQRGDVLTVKDLYHALLIQSANNAAVALAEHIASTENKFVELMNQKAKQLGLSSATAFVNASGLQQADGTETKMPAIDVAKLAYHLLKDYPEILKVTQLTQSQLAFNNILVKSTNKMLDTNNQELYFKGMDGLKSGFTDSAGYCFTGTAIQEDKRFISVVMGTDSIDNRFTESRKLLSYGFQVIESSAEKNNAS
ncbi:D-alanyl-D-alanine carboxypeptidase [Bacillus cereus HuB4-4]|uniref:D-alanyl-D-alanine carboxypeptidase n=1 Tax=Bacillus cereus HuB4-4 TaxID=1053211 RepID=A0A9W5QWS1_BACCE|nr:D-alanyl-D-alanine carboxypeptidase family protein [Bacillus cereus]EOP90894.1 D-alanyl-D-alanine carboxypeptidase [Bacillus cereus HuB4-4]